MPRLVLTRRTGEQVLLRLPGGEVVRVAVQWARDERCSLLFEAPAAVQIARGEVAARRELDERLAQARRRAALFGRNP